MEDKRKETLQEQPDTGKKEESRGMALGMCLGLAVGAGIGAATGNLSVWMGVGACVSA